jgi:hypothetical protein
MTTTNWNTSLSITKFDPSLGTLTGINFYLQADVRGDVRFESLDAEPATVVTYLQAMVTLQRPDLSTIVVTTPVANNIDDVSAFDGVIDFGGTSGKTYLNLNASDNTSVNSPPPAGDLALFTGLGQILLPIFAQGTSQANGAGNIISQFNTEASAVGRVTYTYEDTPPVPEPSSLALLLMGSGVVALGTRMRKLRK